MIKVKVLDFYLIILSFCFIKKKCLVIIIIKKKKLLSEFGEANGGGGRPPPWVEEISPILPCSSITAYSDLARILNQTPNQFLGATQI